jgi:hypothetical protein
VPSPALTPHLDPLPGEQPANNAARLVDGGRVAYLIIMATDRPARIVATARAPKQARKPAVRREFFAPDRRPRVGFNGGWCDARPASLGRGLRRSNWGVLQRWGCVAGRHQNAPAYGGIILTTNAGTQPQATQVSA